MGWFRGRILGAGIAMLLTAGCATTTAAPTTDGGSPPGGAVGTRMADAIAAQVGGGQDYQDIRAIVVLVGGKTVFEHGYNSSSDRYRDIHSVTKSVMSTLIGIAVGEGKLRLDQKLAELVVAISSEFDATHQGVDGSVLDYLVRWVIAPTLQ